MLILFFLSCSIFLSGQVLLHIICLFSVFIFLYSSYKTINSLFNVCWKHSQFSDTSLILCLFCFNMVDLEFLRSKLSAFLLCFLLCLENPYLSQEPMNNYPTFLHFRTFKYMWNLFGNII